MDVVLLEADEIDITALGPVLVEQDSRDFLGTTATEGVDQDDAFPIECALREHASGYEMDCDSAGIARPTMARGKKRASSELP